MSAQAALNVFQITKQPTGSIETITPDIAAAWLDVNASNRNVRRNTVLAYARDMEAGNWQFTGESIKFADDGGLLDGQHRLQAIIQSGMTVQMLVMRNLTRDAQGVMDTGRKRTASDALAINNEKHSALLASTIKLALGVASGAPDPGRYETTHAEVQEFVDSNSDIREAVLFSSKVARRTDCPPTVVAFTFWVMSRIDPVDAYQFWTAAADKVGLREGDPVIALTTRFAEARRNRETLSKRIYLSFIYRAWNARRTGKTMRVLRVNSSNGGLIPIVDPR